MKKRHLYIGLFVLSVLIGAWNIYILKIEWNEYQKLRSEFEQTRHLIEFSEKVARFVHEIQKERGLSAAFLGSKGDDEFRSRLNAQRLNSDNAFSNLLHMVNGLKAYPVPSSFTHSVNDALKQREEIYDLRNKIADLAISPNEEIDAYSTINSRFVGLIPLAAKSAPNREIALRLYDNGLISECKESAGVERATLSNVFAAKQYQEEMYERTVSIHAVYTACIEALKSRLSDKEHSVLLETIDEKPFQIADHYFYDVVEKNRFVDAASWFDVATEKIDLIEMMRKSFQENLIRDLNRMENSALHRSAIFLIGSISVGFILLILTLAMIRKILQTMTDLRISSTVFDSHEGVLVTDIHGTIVRANAAFENITGFGQDEIIGKTPALLKSGIQSGDFYKELWETLETTGKWKGEIVNRKKNGELYHEWLSISTVMDDYGETTHYVAIFSDISSKKAAENKIHELAFYDPLTKLPNRRQLLDRLEQALNKQSRHETYGMLAFIDLDNFKLVNDTKGHLMGDELLVQAAKRLQGCIRAEDTIARHGGDEFVVMIEEIASGRDEAIHHATSIGEKIIEALREPFELGGELFYVTGSVGMAIIYDHIQSATDILAHADAAMYSAKQAGRNSYRFFDTELQAVLLKRIEFENAIYKALENREFELYYQLQYNESQKAYGAEALIRWPHPVKGFISPGEFIPVSEESSLIIAIGEWIIEEACLTLQEWSRDERFSSIIMSINVSAKQFLNGKFVSTIEEALIKYAINPSRLRLELTESIFAHDVSKIHETMHYLRGLGLTFALDDFGTGYSSLSYLKQFAFDEIKIDQSFIRDINRDESDWILVKAIVAMSEALDIEVIAEGVETLSQFEMLRSVGCKRFQGYYFAKPMPKNRLGL
ncbi:MAG: EAL domain-containing protein [Sulfuricurvum sp.]